MISNKDTILQKYGVDHPSRIPGISNKKKFNSLRKNRVESPNQLQSVKLKKLSTLHKHYGSSGFSNLSIIQKREATCLKKYGVKNVQQLDIFKKKRLNTISKKFDDNLTFDS